MTITPAPTVDAGFDQSICSDKNNINIEGRITVATGALWTSDGTGTFSPNANSLQAIYVPSAADKNTNGTITLTLTTNGERWMQQLYRSG